MNFFSSARTGEKKHANRVEYRPTNVYKLTQTYIFLNVLSSRDENYIWLMLNERNMSTGQFSFTFLVYNFSRKLVIIIIFIEMFDLFNIQYGVQMLKDRVSDFHDRQPI